MKLERKVMIATGAEVVKEKQGVRPFPQCNQIWSAPVITGYDEKMVPIEGRRRYIRILRVRKKGTGYNYAKAIEVTDAGVAIPSPVESITVSLASGEMASAYKFESHGKDIS